MPTQYRSVGAGIEDAMWGMALGAEKAENKKKLRAETEGFLTGWNRDKKYKDELSGMSLNELLAEREAAEGLIARDTYERSGEILTNEMKIFIMMNKLDSGLYEDYKTYASLITDKNISEEEKIKALQTFKEKTQPAIELQNFLTDGFASIEDTLEKFGVTIDSEVKEETGHYLPVGYNTGSGSGNFLTDLHEGYPSVFQNRLINPLTMLGDLISEGIPSAIPNISKGLFRRQLTEDATDTATALKNESNLGAEQNLAAELEGRTPRTPWRPSRNRGDRGKDRNKKNDIVNQAADNIRG